ncbi:MAG: hypothetical protein AB7V25_16680 [Mangrovibacterium sp.]
MIPQKIALKNDEQVKLQNEKVVLAVDLNGGSYLDFHLKKLPVNPLCWRDTTPGDPPFAGHFLCFDRWGPPSEAEKANGFTHHGEAIMQRWTVTELLHRGQELAGCTMGCSLPMAGLELSRKIELQEEEPVVSVTEQIQNLNKYGRMFNIVQHVTLAPPFLDRSTFFDNNVEKGFENREDGSLDQEEPVLRWPETIHNGEKVSFRQFTGDWPRVSSFTFGQDDQYGWTVASSHLHHLLIGYIWKINDYPWINFWRSMDGQIPAAFGMEFGTTGLHEPFPVVARKGKIFDRNIYDFLDAGEVITKSFTAFLAEIPNGYQGVDQVRIEPGRLIIREKNKTSGEIIYSLK